MGRFGFKILLACLIMGFGVFYGLDMAKEGIEQINGPFEQQEDVNKSEAIPKIEENTSKDESIESPEDEIMQQLHPVVADNTIHRLADKTGEVIQGTVQGGVEIIVSLFEGIIK